MSEERTFRVVEHGSRALVGRVRVRADGEPRGAYRFGDIIDAKAVTLQWDHDWQAFVVREREKFLARPEALPA